ncbi:MAG: hypothetical protein WD274_09610 [Acidimicrobiia bacterium]
MSPLAARRHRPVEEKGSDPRRCHRHPDPGTFRAAACDDRPGRDKDQRCEGIDGLTEPSGADQLAVDLRSHVSEPMRYRSVRSPAATRGRASVDLRPW